MNFKLIVKYASVPSRQYVLFKALHMYISIVYIINIKTGYILLKQLTIVAISPLVLYNNVINLNLNL